METPGCYWRTVRHLKARQIFARAWFKLYRPRPNLSPAPPLRQPCDAWIETAHHPASMTNSDCFVFLNQMGRLDAMHLLGGWDDPRKSKLWRYNLNYFDDLNAEQAQARRGWHSQLIANWLHHNQPGMGTGWEPFPTSLRIVNWIKAAQAGFDLPVEAVESLAVQVRRLVRRIEHHLSGNHLLANGKALCFAGAFFEGPEADQWFDLGSRLLHAELPQQILADGGHYELSPMYHALVLEDLLDLTNLHRRFRRNPHGQAGVESRIPAMQSWLAALSHPDGEIAFFNDAALGIAPSPAALDHYAQRLGFAPAVQPGPGSTHLQASGYVRLAKASAVLLVDAAEVGPAHQPGHAHADTLSFELSLNGQRLLVNGGTSDYGISLERLRQRGTAAHNTLTIDAGNSSEVWSGFRVGRRANPQDLHIADEGEEITIKAAHDGYVHLAGKPIHQRHWRLSQHALVIRDTVSGAPRLAEAHYHFAPGLVLQNNGRHGHVLRDGHVCARWEVLVGRARIVPSSHHPRFGVSLPSQSLVLLCEENRAELRLLFSQAGSADLSPLGK